MSHQLLVSGGARPQALGRFRNRHSLCRATGRYSEPRTGRGLPKAALQPRGPRRLLTLLRAPEPAPRPGPA